MNKSIHIFSPGTQTSAQGITREFTKGDLKQIAESYNATRHEAPIRIGHEDSDKVPAWGWVKDVKMKGEDLYAEVEFSPLMQDYVDNGLYKKVSASFYAPESKINPEPGQWSLRHVAMLGAQPPAVKGLKGFAYAELSDAEDVFDFAATMELSQENTFDDELGPTTKVEQGPFDTLKEKLDEARKEMVKDKKAAADEEQALEKDEAQADEQSVSQEKEEDTAFAEGEGLKKLVKVKTAKKAAGKQGEEEEEDEDDDEEFNEHLKKDAAKDRKMGKQDRKEAAYDAKKGKGKRAQELDDDADQDDDDADEDDKMMKYAEGATAERTGKIDSIGGSAAQNAKGFSGLSPEEVEGAGPVVSKMPKKDSGRAMEDPQKYNFTEVTVPADLDGEVYVRGFQQAVEAWMEALEQGGDLTYTELGDESFDEGVYAGLEYAELSFAATVDRNGTITDLPAVSDKQPNMPVEEGPVPSNVPKGKKGITKKQGSGIAPGEMVSDQEAYEEPTFDPTNDQGAKKKRGSDSLNTSDTGVKQTPKSEIFYDNAESTAERKEAADRGFEAKRQKKEGRKGEAHETKEIMKLEDEKLKDSHDSKEGYDDRLDEAIGEKDGKESGKKQSMKARRDESKGMEKKKGKNPFAGDSEMHAEGKDTSAGASDKKTYVNKEKPLKREKFEERSGGRFSVGKAGEDGKTGRYTVGKAGKSPVDGGEGFGRDSAKPATAQDGGVKHPGDGTGRNGPAAKSSEQTVDRNKTGKAGKEGETGRYSHTRMMNSGGPSGSGSAIKSPNIRVEQIRSGETPKQVAAEYSEFSERLAELEAQNAKLLAEKRAAELHAQRMQIEDFTESLYAHGRLTDNVIEQAELVEYVVGLQNGTLEFSEGEDAATKLLHMLAKLPQAVSYAELGGASTAPAELPFEDQDPHSQALKLSQEQGIDYAEALKKTLFTTN